MAAFLEERVTSVHHWTERLFSFRTTRNQGFRFQNGHFTLIGLQGEGGAPPLLRAYSFVSPNHEQALEFLSIKVPGGALTSRLQRIRPGDAVVIGTRPTGTLLIDHLRPARRLYLLATGTGLAPFMSIVRDPATYESFERVILVHGVRRAGELAYRAYLSQELPRHEHLGELVQRQLLYYPVVTREPFLRQGRIQALIDSGQMARELALPELHPSEDRVMICGSPAMLRDIKALCERRGFQAGNRGEPGDYLFERAFVEA